MLVQFSVKNFKTFREKAVLSLVASNYDKRTREEDNIIHDPQFDLRILKSAVLFGANASGKSKFIEALEFAKHFIISSSKDSQKGDPIEVDSFKLNSATVDAPSEFEVIFKHQDILYRYGFEATPKEIVSEWLFHKPKTKEIELFYREGGDFETHPRSFSKGRAVIHEGLVRDNALLVSVAAQFNDPIAINVINWFNQLGIVSGIYERGYHGFTMQKSKQAESKNRILELLRVADFGIQDFSLKAFDISELPKLLGETIVRESQDESPSIYSDVLTSHSVFDELGKRIGTKEFSLKEDESSGTKKFFALTGPILDTLEKGDTLIVDELEAKLHPNLVCKLISLFNSREKNPKNAQLIFNTHDTNLLSSGLFRRDQIWFVEKNRFGEASLYSLAEFKSTDVRKNESFEDNYIEGKYGAIPFLNAFDDFFA